KETAMPSFARVLFLTASVVCLTACALDPDTEPSGGATEQGSTTEATPSATVDSAATPASGRFPCRKVTASSIPVYNSQTGPVVSCRFFAGDIFIYLAVVTPPTRYETWCPRHVPITQGTVSFAPAAGTVEVTCPF